MASEKAQLVTTKQNGLCSAGSFGNRETPHQRRAYSHNFLFCALPTNNKRLFDYSMPINIAIVGVGNCAKSLVEGLSYYSDNPTESRGLAHPVLGGYSIADIRVVAAFDIDVRKVGKPLHEALASSPNHTVSLNTIPVSSVIVERGETHDSVIPELRKHFIQESELPACNVIETLRTSGVEVVLNYLPTGSELAARAYAEASLVARCNFINCMPASLAKDVSLRRRFEAAGLVLLGDDIKSQCGATVVNKILLELFASRGIFLTSSTQRNYGGNADHFNLQFRPQSKEHSKEAALCSCLGSHHARPDVSMTYIESQYDHKRAAISLRGEIFGRVPVMIDVNLEDEDSPNSAGVVVDAIRATKILFDSGRSELAPEICPALMKSPSRLLSEPEAANLFNRAIDSCLGQSSRPAVGFRATY